jgi:hypothetical protein
VDDVSYRAVLTDPEAGRGALLRLWARNLPVRGDASAKLGWSYFEGPAGPSEVFLLHDEAGEVGCAGVTVRELWLRERPLRVALLADFAIDRAHRTGLPALILQRAVKRHVDGAYDASYGFPNANAVAIHRRIGYHELGAMCRYVRVLRHADYLARRFERPIVARAAGAVVDAAKLAVRLARTVRPSRTRALRWLPDVDAGFDRLWQATRGSFGITCRRDAAFLRWRFLRKPDERVAIAALVDRARDELRAYAVVGGEPGGMAELHDLYGELDAISDLLTLVMPALYRRGYRAVGIRFLGDPRIPALLLAHHFSLREQNRVVIVHEGKACPIDPAVLRDPNAWYLTDLDEDT